MQASMVVVVICKIVALRTSPRNLQATWCHSVHIMANHSELILVIRACMDLPILHIKVPLDSAK
jgi:hypothetical protein